MPEVQRHLWPYNTLDSFDTQVDWIFSVNLPVDPGLHPGELLACTRIGGVSVLNAGDPEINLHIVDLFMSTAAVELESSKVSTIGTGHQLLLCMIPVSGNENSNGSRKQLGLLRVGRVPEAQRQL